MKKSIITLIALFLLTGCGGGGGDGGEPAPADISGLWQGGGTVSGTYNGQT